MSAKDILLDVAEKLPPEATLNDAIYELDFRQAVQQGIDELDRSSYADRFVRSRCITAHHLILRLNLWRRLSARYSIER